HDCLELGAGTGKFTEKIIKYLPKNIKYLATEPMSGFLDTLKAKCPELETMQCPATKIPLPDTSVKGSRDEVVDHINTMSVVSALDDETKQVVQQKIRDVFNKHFDQSIHDIDLPFETELIVLSKM
ncbi:hypothetical protein FSP39_012252, partial [Pinctada imbricata]